MERQSCRPRLAPSRNPLAVWLLCRAIRRFAQAHRFQSPAANRAAKGFCYHAAMTSAIRSGLLLLATCVCSGSLAEAQHMNAAGAPCQKTSGAGMALDNCFAGTYRAADDQLNQLYKQIRQALTPDQQQQLFAAQRLWLPLRESPAAGQRAIPTKGGMRSLPPTQLALKKRPASERRILRPIYGWVIANSK